MKKILFFSFMLLSFQLSSAFCGFYVAQADASLFNKASEVIIARMGGQTVVTMSSDFEGPVQDFAMVVPVPEVPSREMIRVADPAIFAKLDAYSGPRIVEYYDDDPCETEMFDDWGDDFGSDGFTAEADDGGSEFTDAETRVTIKARYTVGEYDIVVLSAEESGGLVKWLTANKYRIPEKAKSLLDPYIRNGMYFFVVKVNLKEVPAGQKQELRPIQLTYNTDRFMLPIRLGMSNAQGDQDMIVYAFSDVGRIECTNYRTVEIPTDMDIPEFVADTFGAFYSALFDKSWKSAGENAVMTEYSWDLNSSNFTKCDPCATTPPNYAELREAGVFWVGPNTDDFGMSDYEGMLHFTRMHVRYRTETFPQDLLFQATPNNTPFQGRYVVHRVPESDFSCDEGQVYLQQLVERRKEELQALHKLTDWDVQPYRAYPLAYAGLMNVQPWIQKKEDHRKRDEWFLVPADVYKKGPFWIWILGLSTLLILLGRQKKVPFRHLFT